MKIEKINDNQIRCTLTRDDLAQRQLKAQRACLRLREGKIFIPRDDAAGRF